ncbi:uncharacterized protein LOC144644783 isoform X3 [Oculina patagonica]
MKAILAFALCICVQICCGRYFSGRVVEYEPGIPFRDSVFLDGVCEDDPAYADGCPGYAAIEGYCKDYEDFMRKNCPKSCGYCAEESLKPPAPAVCEDDPDYADGCPEMAAVEGYCKDQEDFMRKNCPKTCGYCSEATTQPAVTTESVKPPAPAVCEDDPDYADGCPEMAAVEGYCKDNEDFMRKNCPKSCGYCSEATTEPAVTTESVNPPAPVVCEDDPDYADGCPEMAAVEGYCKDQEDFMRKNCPKSCGYCSEGTAPPPSPVECKDDPEYKNDCKDIAATPGFCQEQKEFTEKHCQLSCDWCESPITKAPIEEICEGDLPKWAAFCPTWAEAGECNDREKQVFMEHYCRKSCNLPCKPEPSPIPSTKPPSPPAFCRDRDANCDKWKSLGLCDDSQQESHMAIYCGVTCDFCRAPNPDECYDKKENCEDLKKAGFCASTVPTMEYEVKTNCLETCEFCVPDSP